MKFTVSFLLSLTLLIGCLAGCEAAPTGGGSPAEGGSPAGPGPDPVPGEVPTYHPMKSDVNIDTAHADIAAAIAKKVGASIDEIAHSPVRYCGIDKAKEGEKAIWIQLLPERDPYSTSSVELRKRIHALYVYYPCDYDPSLFSEEELIEKGARRTFGYMGIPEAADKLPGIVCVHGGAGHAYARYTLEAMQHGFAAIALDTEGCRNITGGDNYSESADAYETDPLGHKPKDSFIMQAADPEHQWLYWAVADTAIANTVLRSLAEVDESKVGLTGISWGGLIAASTICYDYRFAFCIPVYLSSYTWATVASDVGNLKAHRIAQKIWQNPELLKASPVPTLLLAGDNDHFATINTQMSTLDALSNGTLIIKHNYNHSQQAGASASEIYRFAHTVLGSAKGFIRTDKEPDAALGRSYTLKLSVPEDLEKVTVTLHWLPAPLAPYNQQTKPTWESAELKVGEDGTVNVTVPEEAYMYYLSYSGFDSRMSALNRNSPYASSIPYAPGSIYSSSNVILLGGSSVTE